MYKLIAAPVILSIFAVSCGGQTQPGNDLQARGGSANTPLTSSAQASAQSTIQTGSLMKCLTVSGWELEVVAKNCRLHQNPRTPFPLCILTETVPFGGADFGISIPIE